MALRFQLAAATAKPTCEGKKSGQAGSGKANTRGGGGVADKENAPPSNSPMTAQAAAAAAAAEAEEADEADEVRGATSEFVHAAAQGDARSLAAALSPSADAAAEAVYAQVLGAALVAAVAHSHVDCVRLLLHAGASLEASGPHRVSPLHAAAAAGDEAVLALVRSRSVTSGQPERSQARHLSSATARAPWSVTSEQRLRESWTRLFSSATIPIPSLERSPSSDAARRSARFMLL